MGEGVAALAPAPRKPADFSAARLRQEAVSQRLAEGRPVETIVAELVFDGQVMSCSNTAGRLRDASRAARYLRRLGRAGRCCRLIQIQLSSPAD